MDWTLALDRNRMALLRIVAGLVVMVGDGLRVPRQVRLAILAVLRPAEAAMRRLVVIAARGMEPVPVVPRQGSTKRIAAPGKARRAPSFRLFDPRRRVGLLNAPRCRGHAVRLSGFGFDDPVFAKRPAEDSEAVSAVAVSRRVRALNAALEDIPAQARRLVRALARAGQKYLRPMRPGRPPGYRARGRDEIDTLLSNCHALALYALHPPDTG